MSLGFYIPDGVASMREIIEKCNLSKSEKEAAIQLGVEQIRVSCELDAVEMAAEASKSAINHAGLTDADIDVIIYLPSRIPTHFISSDATRLQNLLGATNASCFSVGDLGCASINASLYVAQHILNSDLNVKHVLISHGSASLPNRYRKGVSVSGDAGMGIILSRDVGHKILSTKMHTEGRYWDLYRAEFRNILDGAYEEVCSNETLKFQLALSSRNRYKDLLHEISASFEHGTPNLNHFVMQNLSIPAFKFNEEAFSIRFSNSCYTNCRQYGHLGPIDVMLNFFTGVESGEFGRGQNICIMNNSPVASWGVILVQI